MSVLVVGDIGAVDGMFHVGDEAMFDAAQQELRSRGLEVTAVSSAPQESAHRYGVGAVRRLGFDGLTRTQAAARKGLLLEAAAGRARLDTDDPAHDVLSALDRTTGLLNAGGGNLASRWPVHLFERGTLVALARSRGIPVVFSGQTLGPDLLPEDAAALRDTVAAATLFGAREPTTHRLVEDWGLSPRLLVDDASFLAPAERGPRAPGVLVSLSGWYAHRPADEVDARLARLLDAAAALTGAPVAFHAHFGALDDPPGAPLRGDAVVHDRVRRRMSTESILVPTTDSADAVALAQSARLLITSRYHPAVFAAPAGVPILALAADEYTEVKLGGVLGHWGRGGPASLDGLDEPEALLRSVLDGADDTRRRAEERRSGHRADAAAWWDDVAAVLGR